MGTRENVLQCAADMFSDKPYGKVSLREIGRAAGVNPSAIYYYFGNKEKLYQAVCGKQSGKQESTDCRKRIREEATRLFEAYGYEEVTIRQIGAAAGVNSAAISYYFGGKRELYREVLNHVTEIILEFSSRSQEPGMSPANIIWLYCRCIMEVHREKPTAHGLVFRELLHPSDVLDEFIKGRLMLVFQTLRQAVEEGIRKGEFRKDISVDDAVAIWAGMVNFFFISRQARRHITKKQISMEKYMKQAYEIFMAGIERKS